MAKPFAVRFWRARFRPSLRVIILLLMFITLATPLAGLVFFRVFENQLIRKTEAELIAQGAALSAAMQAQTRYLPLDMLGSPSIPPLDDLGRYAPAVPTLDLTVDGVSPPRPPAREVRRLFSRERSIWANIGAELEPLLLETSRLTLAGLIALDPEGRILTGPERGLSLAHAPEVAEALSGGLGERLRIRERDEGLHWLYDLTRGSNVRVFVALPVIDRGHVAGVIYASRTPSNMLQVAWRERRTLAFAAGATLAALMVFGLIASRTITGPIRALTLRTKQIDAGEREALRPLERHGTREIEILSEAFLRSARRLHDRSENVSAFAAHVVHELKSPLTAIKGAAELISDAEDEMTPETRRAFLANIASDAERMTLLVRRLLEMARAEQSGGEGRGACSVDAAAARISAAIEVKLTGEGGARVSMGADNLLAVLGNLADNSARCGASVSEITVTAERGRARITVQDDGPGISEGNRERIFDPFFTTRRKEGGTGMGLSIIRSLIEAHDGTINLAPSAAGARFEIDLPLAPKEN